MAISWIFILALLYFGNFLAKRSRFLLALNFPGSLVGGIIGCLLLVILRRAFSTQIEIPAGPRDLLLVIFFICSGLAMTIDSWKSAGKSLISLSAICALFVVVQNIVGILLMMMFGQPAIYGVMGGSVAYVGGLGSAVAWGKEAVAAGASNAVEVGVVSATLGLLISALISGPYVAFVMKRDRIKGSLVEEHEKDNPKAVANSIVQESKSFTETEIIMGLLLVCVSLFFGDVFGDFVARFGMVFPRFLSAMLAGAVLSVGLEKIKFSFDRTLVDKMGSICLNIFIVMTLAGVEFSKLQGAVGSILVLAIAQTIITIILVHLTIYIWLGKNYESIAIAGGFMGMILGSFAVAMATVRNTEKLYGRAPRAVLLVTLVGGAVSNFANALLTLAFFKILL